MRLDRQINNNNKRQQIEQKGQKIMSSEDIFLSSLLDFSSIPTKRTEYTNMQLPSTSQRNNSVLQEQKKSNSERQVMRNSENQLGNGNQKLLKAFNTLREKLANTSRQNMVLKESIQVMQKEQQQVGEKEGYWMNQVHTLTKKLTTSEQQCGQYKLRLGNVKQCMVQNEQRSQEVGRSRHMIHSLIEENKRLKEELKISMGLSVQEKLQLQQEIQTLRMKQAQATKQVQQAQSQLYSKNSQFIKLQNQHKKLKLIYDQQLFLNKTSSETIILQQENQQLKLTNQQLNTKLNKEKNKKYQLQTKLLELQEKVRLFGTKTDICQGELKTAIHKISLVQKQNNQAQKYANQALNQKLSWEEKFLHSTVILEEIIARVKRQLTGDTVELAKTCQYRLNKLKNDQKIYIKDKPLQKIPQSSSAKKSRSQSKKRISNIQEFKQEEKVLIQENRFITFSNTQTDQFLNSSRKQDDFSKTVPKQQSQQNFTKNLDEVKKKLLFNEIPSSSNAKTFLNELSSGPAQKTHSPLSQISMNTIQKGQVNLEAKIRKEREMMERKLREKILYHKIEDAPSQPLKNKLRDEYFSINSMDY